MNAHSAPDRSADTPPAGDRVGTRRQPLAHPSIGHLAPADWVCLGYLAVTALVAVAVWSQSPDALWNVSAHLAPRAVAAVAILALARRWDCKTGLRGAVRIAYPVLLVPLCYLEVPQLVDAWGRRPLDAAMVDLDQWLFGGQPCLWLRRLHHPLLTEPLMIAYACFWPMSVVSWAILWQRHRDWRPRYFAFVVTLGFLSSYLGCLAVPVRGPCHFLEETQPLPQGLVLTRPLQAFVTGATRGDRGVYDAFPSGHTIVSLLVVWAAWRVDRRQCAVLLPLAGLIVFGTLYLQYHYAIDLVVGAIWAVVTARFIRWWWERSGEEASRALVPPSPRSR